MNKKWVSLHMDRKRTLFYIASFSLASFLVFVFMLLPLKPVLGQLDVEANSNYLYSGEADKLIESDCYYSFGADICFSVSKEVQVALNADVVMQPAGMHYSGLIYWNASLLKKDEIAISHNLASSSGKSIGDSLYSKHIVTGEILEYTIAEVLPESLYTRGSKNRAFNDGIIIMGADSNYIDNISYKTVIFTTEPVEIVFDKTQGSLSNILYRDEEIKALCIKTLPYCVTLIVLSAGFAVAFAYIIKKSIAGNYRREMIAGYDKRVLERAYNLLSMGCGFASILVMFIASLVLLAIVGINSFEIILLIVSVMTEGFCSFGASTYYRRCLWRQ